MKIKYSILFLISVFFVTGCIDNNKQKLIKRAKKLKELKDYKEAIRTYDEIIELDESDEMPNVLKGHIYVELEKIKKA